MKKYAVTFYYHTNCVVEVEAENEREALNKANEKICTDRKYEQEILDGLQEDDSPDVEEIC